MDKKKLSEADICLKFVTPALAASGWDVHEQVFQEFTLKAGRMVVRGQRAARDRRTIRRADYMLCHRPGIPIAVIEAKDNSHFPLPPLAEQHRIVARVEQLLRLCADLRERLQQSRATQAHLAGALVSAAVQSPAC
jgi:type I site-specific restriction endonuclease